MRRLSEERSFAALAICLGFAAGLGLATPPLSWGRVVEVTPKSHHTPLTSTTDGEAGFQVQAGSTLSLELVGPGNLTVTVRLNHTSKRPAISGEIEVLRERKTIKKIKLNLISSRVGGYREDSSLHMSLPKVFRIAVPVGTHAYGVALKAGRGTSMTVQLSYETSAEQVAAKEGGAGDALPLVPLVPPVTQEKEKKPEDLALTESLLKKPAERHPAPPGSRKRPADGTTGSELSSSTEEPGSTEDSVSVVKTDESEHSDAFDLSESAEEANARKAKDPARSRSSIKKSVWDDEGAREGDGEGEGEGERAAVVSIGLKGGQISPLQRIGGTSLTCGLEVSYLALGARLGVGVEAGYYLYHLDIIYYRRQLVLEVIPLSVQIFYRLLGSSSPWDVFLGAGGDAFVVNATDKRYDVDFTIKKKSGVLFGGHLSLGVEYRVGPGRLLAEVRGGMSTGDALIWKKANISGIATSVGYRLEF